MKSQSLPLETIALVLIIIIALSVLILFILSEYGQGKGPTEDIIGLGDEKLRGAECAVKGEYYCPLPQIDDCVEDCNIGCGGRTSQNYVCK